MITLSDDDKRELYGDAIFDELKAIHQNIDTIQIRTAILEENVQHQGVLSEVMAGQLQTVFEYLDNIRVMNENIAAMNTKVNKHGDEIELLRTIVISHEQDIRYLKTA